MNAELAEGGLGSLWLQQNATIDQVNIRVAFLSAFLHNLKSLLWDGQITHISVTLSNVPQLTLSVCNQVSKHYTAQTDHLNRTIRETNKQRQMLQTRAYPELTKLVHKRNTAFQRTWLCQQAYAQMKQQLLGEC